MHGMHVGVHIHECIYTRKKGEEKCLSLKIYICNFNMHFTALCKTRICIITCANMHHLLHKSHGSPDVHATTSVAKGKQASRARTHRRSREQSRNGGGEQAPTLRGSDWFSRQKRLVFGGMTPTWCR